MSTGLERQKSTQSPPARFPLPALALFIVLVSLAYLFLQGRAQNQNNGAAVSSDFQPLAQVDLAARAYHGDTVVQFTLEKTAVVNIFYTIPNIDTAYFDLRLIGTEGQSYVILHSEDFKTDEAGGGLWEQGLAPGDYHLELSAPQSPAVLSIYREHR